MKHKGKYFYVYFPKDHNIREGDKVYKWIGLSKMQGTILNINYTGFRQSNTRIQCFCKKV